MIVPFTKTYKTRVTAILSPREKALFFDQLNADYKIRFEFLYQTAMRLREAMYFADHPELYKKENALIALPHVPGMGKKMCTIRARHILLSPQGMRTVEEFIDKKMTFPSYQAMLDVCKRAARDGDFKPDGIVPKMFRKMYISHLMACYPELQSKIAQSVGHTVETMEANYLIYGWKKDDVVQMRSGNEGWGVAV